MPNDTMTKFNVATGGREAFSKAELEGLKRLELENALIKMSPKVRHERLEAKIAPLRDELMRKSKAGPFLSGEARRRLEEATAKAFQEIAEAELEEMAQRAVEMEERKGTIDEQHAEHVRWNFSQKLAGRLAGMSAEDQATFDEQRRLCLTGHDTARVIGDDEAAAVYLNRLDQMGALEPSPERLDEWLAALLEPKISPCGIDQHAYADHVATVRERYNLDAQTKLRTRRSK